MKNNNINCPECGSEISAEYIAQHIDINKLAETEVAAAVAKARAEETAKHAAAQKQLEVKEAALKKQAEDMKTRLDKEVEKQLQAKLKSEQRKLEKNLKKKLTAEMSEANAEREKELKELSEQLKKSKGLEAKLKRIEREKENMKADLELDLENRLTEQLKKQEAEVAKRKEAEYSLKLKESDERNKKYQEQIAELKRQSELGVARTQGNIQEDYIAETLQQAFPTDEIEQIRSGKTGADIVLHVKHLGQPLGSILIESKRTASFQSKWLTKLKSNQAEKRAEVAVLITETMPKGMDGSGVRDDIWVCDFAEFLVVIKALRYQLMRLADARHAISARSSTAEIVYDYMHGDQFRTHLSNILAHFRNLREDLTKAKQYNMTSWRKQENHIDSVVESFLHLSADLSSLTPDIPQLSPGDTEAKQLGTGDASGGPKKRPRQAS